MSDFMAARSQMAMSLAFHIIFAAVGIGMPLLMVIAEGRWLRTRDDEKYHIQNLHLLHHFQNLPLEKPKKYAIVTARFGFHESPRMLCPLQAHSRELIVNPKPPAIYWFQEWIEVDPKEHG
jgi:hypothetical protein